MSNYNKLLNNLDTLKLKKFKDNLDNHIDLINDKKKDFVDSLYDLTNLEIELQIEQQINHSIQFAGFPFNKTLDDFDFSFQPGINKEKILELKNLRFIENKENVLFVGSPGVGKTHLATAIGIYAAKNKMQTYFINCHELISQLKKAQSENRITTKLKTLAKYKLLIIDELGFLPIDIDGANLLFQLINKRYEKNSTIITTNKSFSKWNELFGDFTLANAILDRLIHHSIIFNINGKSYRIKDKLLDDNNARNEEVISA